MSAEQVFGDLEVTVQVNGPRVVIRVIGDLDLLTSPDLGAVMNAVVGHGHQHVVLDAGSLTFMDAHGLDIVAGIATRLHATGGTLTVRAATPLIRRILDLTRVSELVRFETAELRPGRLGPEQTLAQGTARPAHHRGMTSEPIPAIHGAIDAALGLVVALAAATVGGADGVSVSLSRHGRIETVASSNDTVAKMDRDQYATGEGPCLSAAAEGRWFHVESVAEETRWEQFTARARRDGIASILSTPLMRAARPLGALNIYSKSDRAFGTSEQRLAAVFAAHTSVLLGDADVDTSATDAGARVRLALRSREVIAQAQGVMMSRDNMSAEAALAALRRSATRTATPMRVVAEHVLESTALARDPDA